MSLKNGQRWLSAQNTGHWGKDHLAAGLQFNKSVHIWPNRKYDVICMKWSSWIQTWKMEISHTVSVLSSSEPWDEHRGSIGRAVAYNTRGPRFESSHRYTLYYLYTANWIEKTKKEKRGLEWPNFWKTPGITNQMLFFKKGQSRPLFVFSSFPHDAIQI